MSTKFTIDLELQGFERAMKRLWKFDAELGTELKKTMKSQANKMLRAAKKNIPERTGNLKRVGLKVYVIKPKRKESGFNGIVLQMQPRAVLGIPASADYYYPSLIESGFTDRGGSKVQGVHFLRDAYFKFKEPARAAMKDKIRDRIAKVNREAGRIVL